MLEIVRSREMNISVKIFSSTVNEIGMELFITLGTKH